MDQPQSPLPWVLLSAVWQGALTQEQAVLLRYEVACFNQPQTISAKLAQELLLDHLWGGDKTVH